MIQNVRSRLSTASSSAVTGRTWWSGLPDPAALNARLVEAGVPVRSLAVQRRSLEEIVLDVTGTGSDQFGVTSAGLVPPRGT